MDANLFYYLLKYNKINNHKILERNITS